MRNNLEAQLTKVLAALKDDPQNDALRLLESQTRRAIQMSPPNTTGSDVNILSSFQLPKACELRIGQTCEALCEFDGRWKEGKILAILEDSATVSFSDRGSSQHCALSNVRPKLNEGSQNHTALVQRASKPMPIRRHKRNKPTRAEYIKSKEEEHEAKQESWLRFSRASNFKPK